MRVLIKYIFFNNEFQSEMLNFYTMSVLRPDNNSTDIEDIVFLYRYIFLAFCIAFL